jgi:hypothetical protein
MGHFRAVVRTYRRLGHEAPVESKVRLDWTNVWEGTPTYIRTELEPFVSETERPLAMLRTPERWTAERRWWGRRPLCASAAGLLVATSRGLLWAASEPRTTPDGLSFGVNVAVVRPERVQGRGDRKPGEHGCAAPEGWRQGGVPRSGGAFRR